MRKFADIFCMHMKIFATALLTYLFMITSCNTTKPEAGDIEKVQWLVGYWDRTSVKEGRSAHERWKRISVDELEGWGVSLRGTDTSFVEGLRIVRRDGSLFYIADVPENKEPVAFEFTELTTSAFVCENLTHDFPKRIEYKLSGDTLTATTSGDGNEISFSFIKRN